jgi:hypothetical protein
MRRLLVATALTLLGTVPLHAEPPGRDYVGLQLGRASVAVDEADSVESTLAVARFGHFVYQDVALEARLGFGTGEAATRVGATDVDVDLQGLAGLYLTMHLPLAGVADLYAVAGGTRVAVETAPALRDEAIAYETDFSYGGGVSLHLGPRVALRAEYLAYLQTIDLDLSALTVELAYRF